MRKASRSGCFAAAKAINITEHWYVSNPPSGSCEVRRNLKPSATTG